jgi:hypothetical protein
MPDVKKAYQQVDEPLKAQLSGVRSMMLKDATAHRPEGSKADGANEMLRSKVVEVEAPKATPNMPAKGQERER